MQPMVLEKGVFEPPMSTRTFLTYLDATKIVKPLHAQECKNVFAYEFTIVTFFGPLISRHCQSLSTHK